MGLTICVIIDCGFVLEVVGDGSLLFGITSIQRFIVDLIFAHSDGEILLLNVKRSTQRSFSQKVCLQVKFGGKTSQLLPIASHNNRIARFIHSLRGLGHTLHYEIFQNLGIFL